MDLYYCVSVFHPNTEFYFVCNRPETMQLGLVENNFFAASVISVLSHHGLNLQ